MVFCVYMVSLTAESAPFINHHSFRTHTHSGWVKCTVHTSGIYRNNRSNALMDETIATCALSKENDIQIMYTQRNSDATAIIFNNIYLTIYFILSDDLKQKKNYCLAWDGWNGSENVCRQFATNNFVCYEYLYCTKDRGSTESWWCDFCNISSLQQFKKLFFDRFYSVVRSHFIT